MRTLSTTKSHDHVSVEYRSPRPSDLSDLYHLDSKCFDEQWSFDQWRRVLSNYIVSVAAINDVPIGFCVSRMVEDVIVLEKVAVQAAKRQLGIGSEFIHTLVCYGAEYGCSRIETTIPESDAYAIHPFLTHNSFIPGVLLGDYFVAYGTAEDGIRFKRTI